MAPKKLKVAPKIRKWPTLFQCGESGGERKFQPRAGP